jgi:hypothetical protein
MIIGCAQDTQGSLHIDPLLLSLEGTVMINYNREGVRAYVKSFERAPPDYLSVPKWIRRISTVRGCAASSTDPMVALKMSTEGCYLMRCREVLLLAEEHRTALATSANMTIPRSRPSAPDARISAGEVQEKVVRGLERAVALIEILHSRLGLSVMSAFFLPPELCSSSEPRLRPSFHSEATSRSGATTMPDSDAARSSQRQAVLVSRELVEDWNSAEFGHRGGGSADRGGGKQLQQEAEQRNDAQNLSSSFSDSPPPPLLEEAILAKTRDPRRCVAA